ncbi:uncharacterized protein LOC125873645 [Solanum stenotomum]|uniref:uncharacterized protein LOC125873645 n=1 Tax=Solanum stenotomum TaxID=172797 RepID=UPI0020D1AAEE|nr:uncharacterized protein LOC125873645 [Solanum stenotomum]
MPHFNPLSSIVNQNKLDGPNYVDWKQNLDIVLTFEGYKFVLVEECPIKSADPTDDEFQAYDKWVKADNMGRCNILASMANVLQHQHQSMTSAYDMLVSLKEMLGEQNRVAKQTAMKSLLTTKMVEGSFVREHVLKLMSYLNELEILGAEIDKESQVEMILQTLPDRFQQFRLNYYMNKMDMSLAKLLNELQATETIIKQQAHATFLVDKVGPSSSKPTKFQKKKKNPRQAVTPGGAKGGVSNPKGKCFHRKQPGHYKKQYPDFQAKMKNKESYDRIPEEPNTEPLNYAEALHDKDADMLIIAMKSEMESMYSNQVWDLVEPLVVVKPIGCKWIFKKNRGVDGRVKTFKDRLVAKGFTQKEGINYQEKFSSVAMLKSVRILLSIAAHYNYEIWQMDVKTTFLNGSLDECIYNPKVS